MAETGSAEEPLLSHACAELHTSGEVLTHTGKLSQRGPFSGSSVAIIAALLVLFSLFVEYDSALATDAHVGQYYLWYIHVAIMIFVGFGFLMTFLKSYSYSAVGLNFVSSAFVILFAILCVGFSQQEIWKGGRKIQLDLPLLIDGNFCAGAAMISFGAVLGKVTPSQLLWLLLLEVPLYTINARLASHFGALDIGGSITIHAFGAYYGLAASMVLSKKGAGSDHPRNGASYTSDMTAMIGTLFLWIFWPSFNGALASNPANPASPAQFNCVVNTVLSLLGACIAAYAASAAVHGKFDMVHIQNATLAGGVGVGSAANLSLSPGGALAIGIITGCVSTLGFAYLLPLLERSLKLRDTCGVHNLHGIPGLLGGLAAGIAALADVNAGAILHASKTAQLVAQLIALAITLAIAIGGGLIGGLLLQKIPQSLDIEDMYDDEVLWEG